MSRLKHIAADARAAGNMRRQRARTVRALAGLYVVLLLASVGCLQLDVNIALQPDGHAVVTERLQFSRALLDLDDPKTATLAAMLSRQSAEERMKFMGDGVTLTSHEIRDGRLASRESVAVFRVADLDKFTYVTPFLPGDNVDQLQALSTRFHAPMRDGSSWEHIAGWLGVNFVPVADPRARRKPATQPEPPPSPAEVQMVRDMRPVMADLMRNLRIKVTFTTYAPVLRASFGWRNSNTGTNIVDLVDFAPDQNNDMHGAPWMDNEEIMLDLLRLRWTSPVVAEHLRGWASNPTLPAVHRQGAVYFRPSRQLFDRFFAGQTLTHHRTGQTPAKFEVIGYTGPNMADPQKGQN